MKMNRATLIVFAAGLTLFLASLPALANPINVSNIVLTFGPTTSPNHAAVSSTGGTNAGSTINLSYRLLEPGSKYDYLTVSGKASANSTASLAGAFTLADVLKPSFYSTGSSYLVANTLISIPISLRFTIDEGTNDTFGKLITQSGSISGTLQAYNVTIPGVSLNGSAIVWGSDPSNPDNTISFSTFGLIAHINGIPNLQSGQWSPLGGDFSTVPEPSGALLLFPGLLLVLSLRKRLFA